MGKTSFPPWEGRSARSSLGPVLVANLALRNLFHGHRQVVLGARFDERWRKVVVRALAQLVVIVVDLPRALGRDDHQRVARVDVLEQLIDAWMDHCLDMVSARCNSLLTMPSSSPAARETSSLTIT